MRKRINGLFLKRLFKEPFSLFLLIAGGIFIYDSWQDDPVIAEAEANTAYGPALPDAGAIKVTPGIAASLKEEFEWLEGREPSQVEVETLIQQWLDDEMIFREALVQGMHLQDGKMREHMIEKIRLLWAGTPDEPTEAEVLDFYQNNIDDYRTEIKVSFVQVFFEQLPEQPQQVLERLQAGETVTGDSYWMGDTMNDYAESILRTSFGGTFYQALLAAGRGHWIGPLASPRGHHYVRVTDVKEPRPMPYREIRDRVKRDAMNERMYARVRAQTEQLREKFQVVREDQADE